METDDSGRFFSAVIAETTGVPVRSVINLLDIVTYVREEGAASLGVPEKAFAAMADLVKSQRPPATRS
jgi:hypothetical protein